LFYIDTKPIIVWPRVAQWVR